MANVFVITETAFTKVEARRRGRWIHIYRTTTSISGREREALVAEIDMAQLPDLVKWANETNPTSAPGLEA